MKILVIGPAYPYRGGLAAFNERLAKQFAQDGHEVELYTFTLQYPSFLFPGKTQYSDGPEPEGLKIRRTINSVNPINWVRQGALLRKRNADLAIVRYWMPFMAPCMGTIARQIRRGGKTKVIALVDNIVPHERHFYDTPLSKYFTGSVDAFLYMSHSVGKELDEFDSKKPRIFAPHPVYDIFGDKISRDKALDSLGLPKDKRYLLFFGFIRDYKGLDLLMHAMADKRVQELGNVELIVAGEFYGNEHKYKYLEKDLGLQGKIRWFSEFIPDNKVGQFFSAADLVVQPYKTATQSGVTQVAYHFEKPMVVTNVGGLAEIVPDGKAGYVVEPNSDAVAAAIADYFNNKNEESFREGILAEKRRYSWSGFAELIMKN